MKRFFLVAVAAMFFVASGGLFAQTASPVTLYGLQLDTGTKTAAATAGAATLNKASGIVTSEALVTPIAGTYVLTLTDASIAATDLVFASVALGTSTTGLPDVTSVRPSAGSVVITVQNAGTAVFNGTIKISFFVLKA